MHSVLHYRERAARVRTLASSDADLALREQLESMASDYDEIADELEVQETETRHTANAVAAYADRLAAPRGTSPAIAIRVGAAGVRGAATER
jgi:hypothetical protein